jgi:hypothetical protein
VKGRAALAAAAVAVLPLVAQAECRLALALGLDVSGSVDGGEYRLQLHGLAEALVDEDVRAALLAAPGIHVSLAVYEWSSSSYQNLFVDWTDITDADALDALGERVLAHRRSDAPQATGLGTALDFGTDLLDDRSDCWDRTLDISADGRNNDWPEPQRLRDLGHLGEHRINGLAVASSALGSAGTTSPVGARELSEYFEAQIIHGPDAFVEVALGYRDYGRAMKRKLLREIATLPLGQAPATRPAGVEIADAGMQGPGATAQ